MEGREWLTKIQTMIQVTILLSDVYFVFKSKKKSPQKHSPHLKHTQKEKIKIQQKCSMFLNVLNHRFSKNLLILPVLRKLEHE